MNVNKRMAEMNEGEESFQEQKEYYGKKNHENYLRKWVGG